MSDTILSGDFTVYYEADNRQKRIEYTGSGTTYTVRQLYSALQDLFDELGQMDDGIPMSAQTRTEYTIGIIDAGDNNPWYIDPVSVEYLTGGALATNLWERDLPGDGTGNTGIVAMDYTWTSTNLAASDIGKTITMDTDGDTGTIVHFEKTGALAGTIWIRPADNTLANDFNDAPTSGDSFTITGGTSTDGVQAAAATSGESLWANIYSIGTIEDQTHLYVIQDATKLVSAVTDSTFDWWDDGHIDVLLKVKELGTEIDEAVVQVFARQYSKTYSHYEVDLSNGGRNPIPLATGTDLNNDVGWRQITATASSGTGTFDVGDIIGDTDTYSTSTKLGVVTAVGGTASTPIITYYLIGDLTDWSGAADDVYDQTGDGYCTDASVTDAGSAALTGVSNTFGANETFDINEDGTTENYSIVIDCSDEALADVYEWSKYLTMRGQQSEDANTDGIDGEQYIGSDYKIVYTSITGVVSEGDVVIGNTSGATGTIVALNTTDKFAILRNSRGTFSNGETAYKDSGTNELVNCTPSVITPITAAPFGTFAGGKWFCAPGVVLDNVPTSDANNFQLIDDDGNVVSAPTKVAVTVGNTREADSIAVFRLDAAGGIIKKDEYAATAQTRGVTTCVVGSTIDPEVVGKITGGVLRIVDDDGDIEYRVRYGSWSGSTFKLSGHADHDNTTGLTATAGTTTTRIYDTVVDHSLLKVGDYVYNNTRSAYAYITAINAGSNYIDLDRTIASQASGDTYEINTLPVTTTTSDDVYIPFIDAYETTGTAGSPGSESVLVTYATDIPVRVRARQAGDIVPYEADSTIESTGMSNNVIRTSDSIYQ